MVILNFFKRCINTVVKPQEVFKELKKEKKILGILLLIAFTQSILLTCRYDLFKEHSFKQIEKSLILYDNENRAYTISDDIIKNIKEQAPQKALISLIFTETLSYIFLTILAYSIFKIFKGKGSFKQYLSIIGYSYIPILLQYAFTILVSFFTGSLSMETSLTSIAAFLPEDSNIILRNIANKIDLFNIWRFILIYIGAKEITKLDKNKITLVVIFLFVINILIAFTNGFISSIFNK